MKTYELFLLLAVIYLAPHVKISTAFIIGASCMIMSMASLFSKG